MTDPILFISRNKIKEGKVDAFRNHYRSSVPPIEASKPGTLVQLAYENVDATEVTILRLFPNADAMDQQLQGADERSRKAYEYIEPLSVEIYGAPSPSTIEKMKKIAGSGIVVRVNTQFIGGFLRLKSG